MLLEHYFHSRRIRQKVEIELYTPEQRPLAVAGDFLPDAQVPPATPVGLRANTAYAAHGYFAAWAVLPALRRTCSP